jgi:hypothetical protein
MVGPHVGSRWFDVIRKVIIDLLYEDDFITRSILLLFILCLANWSQAIVFLFLLRDHSSCTCGVNIPLVDNPVLLVLLNGELY